MTIKNLSIRIDNNTLDKLHVISDYEGRSVNGQILFLIRYAIKNYEEKYGSINFKNFKSNFISINS